MTHVELFAGIGGIGIAAEQAGFRTVAQVERDPYCIKILEKHWPNVHRCREIRDFPDQDYGAVTLVSGGPPCQPASTAGKRGGRSDDRWLWPEFARIVECLLPAWVLAENPPGILSLENGLAIEEWIARLEAKDYEFLPPLVYPIAALGADHRRYRVFFVAHLDSGRRGKSSGNIDPVQGPFHPTEREEGSSGIGSSSQNVAHLGGIGRGQRGRAERESLDAEQGSKTIANPESRRHEAVSISAGQGAEGQGEIDAARVCEVAADAAIGGWIEGNKNAGGRGERENTEKAGSGLAYCSWWDTQSRLLRMVSRIRGRMDGRRIKALGNSCSPQQVYPILRAIAEVEER